MTDKPTIQRYSFVVEREPAGTIIRAYHAPWEGSQEARNDWVAFSDVAAYVEAARQEERAKIREQEVKPLVDTLKAVVECYHVVHEAQKALAAVEAEQQAEGKAGKETPK